VQLNFNADHQIASGGYRYDAAGIVIVDNTNCYTYDAESRITSVAPQTLMNGLLVCGQTSMSYLYDPGHPDDVPEACR